MGENVLTSGRDTLLVAIPLVLCLVVSIFRLDRVIALPKGSLNQRRPTCGADEFGDPILRDPDGRLSGPGHRSARKENPSALAAESVALIPAQRR